MSLAEGLCPQPPSSSSQGMEPAGSGSTRQLEAVVHQHLPIFHTEHCVFCRCVLGSCEQCAGVQHTVPTESQLWLIWSFCHVEQARTPRSCQLGAGKGHLRHCVHAQCYCCSGGCCFWLVAPTQVPMCCCCCCHPLFCRRTHPGSCQMATTTGTAVTPVRSTQCSSGTHQAPTTWCWQTCRSCLGFGARGIRRGPKP